MKHYAGLDVSMKETAICVVEEAGNIIYEGTAKSDPSLIANQLEKLSCSYERIGLESGSLSRYLTEGLRDQNLPAVCIDSRKMAAILSVNINKTDRNDAVAIAQAMRTNLYREVHLRSDRSVQVGTLLSSRRTIMCQRTQLINTIRGLLKPYGISLGRLGRTQVRERVTLAIEPLDRIVHVGFEALLAAHDVLCEELQKLDGQVRKLVEESNEAMLLTTVPGVGPITALTYLVEVDDPSRFKDSRDVGAYLGLTPRQYSSGDSIRLGRISKCGNSEVRSLLYEAAIVMLTRTKSWSKLKAWGLKLAKKVGMKKAAVAVARKLAVVMHRMLITGSPFSYGELEKAA